MLIWIYHQHLKVQTFFPHGLMEISAPSEPEGRNMIVCKICVCTNISEAFSKVWTISSMIMVWADFDAKS